MATTKSNNEIRRYAQDDGKENDKKEILRDATEESSASAAGELSENSSGATAQTVAAPMTNAQTNEFLIGALAALAESVKQTNAALADVLKERAENLSKSVEKTQTLIGKPDDYSGRAWTEKRVVKLFKDGNKYKDDFYISVNGRRYCIQRGVDVVVPLAVARAIEEHEKQNLSCAAFIEKLTEEAAAREQELAK